jgi:hypothetical protein
MVFVSFLLFGLCVFVVEPEELLLLCWGLWSFFLVLLLPWLCAGGEVFSAALAVG